MVGTQKNMTVLTRFNSFLNTFCICPKEVCNSSFLNSFSEFLFISQFLLNCTKVCRQENFRYMRPLYLMFMLLAKIH